MLKFTFGNSIQVADWEPWPKLKPTIKFSHLLMITPQQTTSYFSIGTLNIWKSILQSNGNKKRRGVECFYLADDN